MGSPILLHSNGFHATFHYFQWGNVIYCSVREKNAWMVGCQVGVCVDVDVDGKAINWVLAVGSVVRCRMLRSRYPHFLQYPLMRVVGKRCHTCSTISRFRWRSIAELYAARMSSLKSENSELSHIDNSMAPPVGNHCTTTPATAWVWKIQPLLTFVGKHLKCFFVIVSTKTIPADHISFLQLWLITQPLAILTPLLHTHTWAAFILHNCLSTGRVLSGLLSLEWKILPTKINNNNKKKHIRRVEI